MALGKPPHTRLEHLIAAHLSTGEDRDTVLLIKELSAARRRGYLTRRELINVCKWKSARAIRHIRRNRPALVKRITAKAFRMRSEEGKLLLLTGMYGVSVPMASAILTLTNPSRYGVLDIRVWQLLNRIGAVTGNANGTGFSFRHWERFLSIIRSFAVLHHVKARDIEHTLFKVHVRYQRGQLYH
jgi:hypothetical protein